jgi:type IV secretion system protein VirB6
MAIENLINNVDAIIFGFVNGAFGEYTPYVEMLWRLMFIIFICVYGYRVFITGKFYGPDLIVSCLKMVVILIIATQWDTFFVFVYNMVTDLPSDVAGVLIASSGDSLATNNLPPEANDQQTANQALSKFFDQGMTAAGNITEGAGWMDFGLYLYSFLVIFATIALTGYAAALIILAKLAVALLLAVGPIFILLLIFANTKNLFEGWLRTLLNYAVIPIFVYGLLAILLSLARGPSDALLANAGPGSSLITYVGAFVLIAFASIILLMQVMNLAASITGGLSLSTLGMPGAVPGALWGGVKKTPGAAYMGKRIFVNPKQTASAAKTRLGEVMKDMREFRKPRP